jgi:hypothetical protein
METLKDAIRRLIAEELHSEMESMIREIVRRVLHEELEIGAPVKRGPGRPRKYPLSEGLSVSAAPRRGGRKRKYTAEQRRERAAAYQRKYRLRKKAEAAKAK